MSQKAFRIKEIILEDTPVSYLRSDVLYTLNVVDGLDQYGNGIVVIVKENVLESIEKAKEAKIDIVRESRGSQELRKQIKLIDELQEFLKAFKEDETEYECIVG